jgi:hypothetical protein
MYTNASVENALRNAGSLAERFSLSFESLVTTAASALDGLRLKTRIVVGAGIGQPDYRSA